MSYKVIIIDDEGRTRSMLKKMVSSTNFPLKIVAEADSVQSGIDVINEHNPDIVLLDIQMPDGSGFDLLDRLRHRNFEIIFVTAHQEFAIRAIKFSALDYILKPVEIEELESALENAIDTIQSKSDLSMRYETLLENLKHSNKRVVIRTKGSMYVVDLKDIIHCQSDRNYTYFHLTDGRKIFTSRTMKEYENVLSLPDFIRCHRSHIINFNHIERYERGDGGIIVMKNGSEVPLSRQSKDRFMELLESL
ncbi:LytR/AlgR family response regulator transcription factor [Brumimicrobium aurantiacum]|uniref:DNA-binding response regulator n=1 Tax=Brumimicrobium aurantiacum TaxID=1737063 RepID=A0A3E1EXB8_9FLAO|nr:LytTR family DNA-binding domain-containing protein [Brumimicrobium aurantiacum]RFC54205.1 DNA-binding response regulator [Brumimicrobium aurantiacum]